MPATATLLLFALATFVLTISPGPGVLYVTARTFIDASRPVAPQVMTLGAVYIAIAVAIDTCYVLAAAAGSRRLLRTVVAHRRSGRIAAVTYIGLGFAADA